MLDFIKGRVINVKPDRVVVQVGGLGFLVKIPLRVSQNIRKEDEVQIYTSLSLKEEKIEVYGFLDVYEKELFEKLIEISGIGPRTAMNIISTYDRETLQRIIEQDDIKALSRVAGIGRKTAQRILLELKGVLPSLKYDKNQIYDDVLSALINLGYKKTDAKEALDKIYDKDKDEATIIKECLTNLAGKHGE